MAGCAPQGVNPAPTPTPAPTTIPVTGPVTKKYSLEKAFSETFSHPVFVTGAGDGSKRLFIVEQSGKIKVYDRETNKSKVFFDISEKVKYQNELGLLGLAFHPDFKKNGLFYVNYTTENPLRTIVSSFKVSAADPDQADKNSEEIILQFDQPFENHNGGMLTFGPDGFLYIGTGDGGSAGDPNGNGQSLKTLLGKILRIDVNKKSAGKNYLVPESNPFFKSTSGDMAEIYAYGMRNPWRFSFDKDTGRLWLADVGQDKYEEIDLVEKGKNYGWNRMEGNHCYKPDDCDQSGLTLPITEYDHTLGKSVSGGYVYHGSKFPELSGAYLYADYVSGRIWYLRYLDNKINTNEVLFDSDLSISSFGTDQDNELFILDYKTGGVYQLKAD
jgi:glucose/arabinose dehydrogenase